MLMLPADVRMQLWANLGAMEARRKLREVIDKDGLSARSLRDLAFEAFGDPVLADKLAAKAVERELRANRTPEW